MSNWRNYRLGEIINVKHGYAFKGEFFTSDPIGTILLTPGNFQIGGGFKKDKFKYYRGPVSDEYVLKEGNVIISMTDLSKDGDTLGYTAIVPKSNGNQYLHNQRLGLAQIKNGEVSLKYLYWVLRTNDYHQFILGTATGTTVKHTSPSRIYDYSFDAPELAIQETIASILSALDDKIELNLEMNKTLEEMAMAIYKEWFVDFGPFRDGEFVDSELGPIPEGWEVKDILDFGEIITGKTPPTAVKENFGSRYPFITIPDMHYQSIIVQTERFLSEMGASTQKNKLIPRGSICVSCIATPGLVAITSSDSHTNQQINTIVPFEKIFQEYIFLFFKSISPEIRLMGSGGTATLNLNRGDFAKIKLKRPPDDVLTSFNHKNRDLMSLIESNFLENSDLGRVRDYLLPKLISGEIRVKDVEQHLQ